MKLLRSLRYLVLFLSVTLLAILPALPALALTTTTVYVNATPYFMSFTIAPNNWGVNVTTGTDVITPSTIYYSNPLDEMVVPSDPVVNGECWFTITNTSTVATTITINWANFTGGDAMTNSNTGDAGATSFGGRSYFSGNDYSTENVVAQTAASAAAFSNLAATTNILFGLTLATQTNAWASSAVMNSAVTVTMTGF